MRPPSVSRSCPARAALAGNPSDLHGGAVVALPVRSIAATVTISAAERFEIPGVQADLRSLSAVDAHVSAVGCGSEQPLVAATLAMLRRGFAADFAPVRVDVETIIPRAVGLAGSSAIVIATLRALVAHHPDAEWSHRLGSDPWLIAATALEVERSILGIIAGPQDRLVQAVDDTIAMDFAAWTPGVDGAPGTFRTLGPLPGTGFVACRPDFATDSGAAHADGTPALPPISDAAAELTEHARRAAEAIAVGSLDQLGAAVDATFDLRRRHMSLEPGHVEMIDLARANGAFANYTGSGGAIVVLCHDTAHAESVATALHARLDCRILELG